MRTVRFGKSVRSTIAKVVLCLFFGLFSPSLVLAQLNLPPLLTLGPLLNQLGNTVSKGDSVTISVTVVSLSALNYQWFLNGAAISGATGSSLTLNNVSAKNTGAYYVGITNAGGGFNSGSVSVLVVDTPPIAVGDAYTATQNTKLTVHSAGVLANDSVVTVGPLTAVLASTVSHGSLTLNSNGGFVYSPATNFYGQDSFTYMANDGMSNSTPATVNLTVLSPAIITTQPQSQQVATNQNANFSVGVTGTGPFTYQWFFGSKLIAAATNSTLTVSNVSSQNAGQYSVVVTNILGATPSVVAQLTVISLPVVSGVNVSSVTTNSVLFNGGLKPGGAVTSYYFQYGLTTNYGTFSVTNTQSEELNDRKNVAAFVTGLAPGTTYHYSMAAVNLAGTVVSSDDTFTTAFLPPQVSIFDATDVTVGTATLKGQVNPQGATAFYYFILQPAAGEAIVSVTNILNATAGAVDVSVPVTGLAEGTTYACSLVAVSSGGVVTTTNKAFSTVTIPPVQVTSSAISSGGEGQSQGSIKLSISSVSGASFTVLGSTNLFLPIANWTVLGTMTEVAPGQYQFNGPASATNGYGFFRIKSN